LSRRSLASWKKQVQKVLPWAEPELITMRGYNNDRSQRRNANIDGEEEEELYTDI